MTKQAISNFLLWISIGIAGRLIIHTPNATPIISLCLFANIVFPRSLALFATLTILVTSDYLLHLIMGYPIFGAWTIFNYSGWLLITLVGLRRFSVKNAIIATCFSAPGFWLWTNLGTWCGNYGLYPHTLNGLIDCYIAALPFLRNGLIAGLIGSIGLILLIKRAQIIAPLHRISCQSR